MTLFFISISLVFFSIVLAIAFIFLRYRFCEQKEYASVLEDTLRVGGAGVLIFDDKDRLKHANAVAENYFETGLASEKLGSQENFPRQLNGKSWVRLAH